MASIADADIASSVTRRPRRSPLKFFLLVYGLSLPIWVISAITNLQLLPGVPLSGLIAVCPVLAAALLVYQENKAAGVIALLKRAFDVRRVTAKIWYLPTLLLMPAVVTLSYAVQRLMGISVPVPHITLLSVLTLSVAFFPFALCEELGWMGYSIDPLQQRWGALPASLILGAVWALWHYPGLVQEHRSVDWIAWWSLGTLAERVIMVWLYNNTGHGVCMLALFHMTDNLTWQLYPIHGSFYDIRLVGVILAVIAVIIIVVWRSATLTRPRHLSFNKG